MRYKVIKGSETAHCCFKATVVDTNRPHLDGNKKPMINGETQEIIYEVLCECFSVESANLIAESLNRETKE